MSASQEKKRRREEREEGVEKRQVQRKLSVRARRKARAITAAVIAVAIVLVVVLVVFNSTLFYNGITAVRIGDHSFKTAEFNYFYNSLFYSTYTELYNNYGDYVSLFLDPNEDLDKQNYSEEQTWEDYLEEQTMTRMQQVCSLCDAAAAEGWQLTEEAQADLDNVISTARSNATSAGYSSFRHYLTSVYSKGLTEEMFTNLVEMEITAEYYSNELIDRLEYTDEELDARYDQDEYEYDLITYCLYFVSGTADEENGIDADTAMNNAYETANIIAGVRTEEDFADVVYQYAPESEKETYADPEATLRENVAPSKLPSAYADWLKDPERSYGETTVIESDTGYYVLLFVGRNDNSYNVRSFRHILVTLTADTETGEYTQAILETGEAEIEDILAQWEEDPTEEHFAELANELSDDPGSNTNGGLYENVALGAMVPEVEDWLFDDARQVGEEPEIVYVSSTNYTGYHLLYYVGEGERYDRSIAENLLKSEWYEAWLAEREPNYAVSTTIAYRFAK